MKRAEAFMALAEDVDDDEEKRMDLLAALKALLEPEYKKLCLCESVRYSDLIKELAQNIDMLHPCKRVDYMNLIALRNSQPIKVDLREAQGSSLFSALVPRNASCCDSILELLLQGVLQDGSVSWNFVPRRRLQAAQFVKRELEQE